MVQPEMAGEDFVHEIVGRVLDHLDLFEDDALLFGDIHRRQRRVQNHVREQVHRDRQVLVEHANVVRGVFLRGKRVELSAD